MSDTKEQIMAALKAPFDPAVIHWRAGATTKDKTQAIALAYIDARDAMKRLDEVMGLDWQTEYSHITPQGVVCRVGLKIDGEWVWRANGAGETQVEAEKGALSDAFKRACVLWGVGRYLYYLPNVWVRYDATKKRLMETPELPKWAMPKPAGDKAMNDPVPADVPATDEGEAIETITEQEIADLKDRLADVDGDEAAFLKALKAQSFEGIQKAGYRDALAMIERKRKRMAQ
jgi:hypothetical protein